MTEPKKITREEANQIIIDWKKADKPYKQIVCVWKGQWYDVRELSADEIMEFAKKLTGKEILKAADIQIG